MMMQKIFFNAPDGVKIVGNWFLAGDNAPAVLLLHMRPATKESWNEFAVKLNVAGFSALAIDLRGHGESTEQNGQKIDFHNFPEGNHTDCRLDVDMALEWLKNQNIGDIFVIGGSIGANLAIDAMARYSEIKKGAALSPGLEYLGVIIDDVIKKIKNKLFLIASKDDEYSYESVQKLHELNPAAEIKLYDNAGHAQNMFTAKPGLMDEIINWLSN